MATMSELLRAAAGQRKPKLTRRYEMREVYGNWMHRWIVECAGGCVELHITDRRKKDLEGFNDFLGGVELHYRFPPPGNEFDAPSHKRCHTLGGGVDCWHDGTSTGADTAIDFFRMGVDSKLDHEWYFGFVEEWMRGRMIPGHEQSGED